MYLWASHSGGLSEFTHRFNQSIPFDHLLIEEDLTASRAHAEMLNKTGILSDREAEQLIGELETTADEIKSHALEIDMDEEDIHSFIEHTLTERLGEVGKKIHTARSRNDQCAVDLRLYAKKALGRVQSALLNLEKAILALAEAHLDTLMPAFTHMQHAQVTTFAHYILSYGQMFYRDLLRLEETFHRLDENPLGSCALATTSFPIDRAMTTEALGFARPTENAMDAVSDRDYVAEILFNNALIMMHLSRLCEELIYFSSTEYGYLSFSEAYSTGSSIMPQKKNPDMAELIRGKTGRVYGDLMTLLTVLKGTPLAYNKDFQEDKEPLFDSVRTVHMALKVMSPMLEELHIHRETMRQSAERGYLNATDLADYLVKKGLPFREAYGIVGAVVESAIEKDLRLEEIPLAAYQRHSPVFDRDLYEAIELDRALENRKVYSGPAKEAVEVQIAHLKKRLTRFESFE